MTDLREKVARVIDPEAYDEVTAEDNDDGAAIFADAWEDALTKADATLNLIGGDGWKLVPVEPTEEMLVALDNLSVEAAGDCPTEHDVYRVIWGAMIAASPPPPVTP
ncbi:hypothetical protein [Phenylobacterium sp.]|uniref:hypothetical protein n=1 Tax=Phenylobacterium sp. TaxID=1871053 RepID=UPI0027301969|nr:hypothetical protein [Phenylobacterium sp.]MDP1873704.1 hypothetical protein [Phenylobacterium sp.]